MKYSVIISSRPATVQRVYQMKRGTELLSAAMLMTISMMAPMPAAKLVSQNLQKPMMQAIRGIQKMAQMPTPTQQMQARRAEMKRVSVFMM